MAGVAEREFNEFFENTPSYVRDTTDFLNRLKEIPEPLPEGAIMFCFDVVKLFPSNAYQDKRAYQHVKMHYK